MTVTDAFLAEGFGLRFVWIDLVNSEHFDGFGHLTDHLPDPEWQAAFIQRWFPGAGLHRPLPEQEFAEFRVLLRSLARTLSEGHAPADGALERLNALLAVPARREVRRDGGSFTLALIPEEWNWSWVKAEIAASAADFLAHHPTRRLKTCPNPGCLWVFYDETKGNTRRWCNDRTCGNRDKVRRLRARRAAEEPEPVALRETN